MKKVVLSAAIAASLALSSCATIMGDKTQLMPISSTPSDATIEITDEKGEQIFKGTTPTNVTLEKSDGSYWGKKNYSVKISKIGYEDQIIPITASANGYYMFGNILFGGLIGWFIVDPNNGAMYTLSPEQVRSTLGNNVSHNNKADDNSIAIVLIQDVPNSLLGKMTRVN